MENSESEKISTIIVFLMVIIFCMIMYKIFKNKNSNVIHTNKKGSIIEILENNAKQNPEKSALMIKRDEHWISINYEDYFQCAKKFSSKINYWIGSNKNVALFGHNNPVWYYTFIGTIMNNCAIVPMFPNIHKKKCEKIINENNVQLVVVENDDQLKILQNLKIDCVKIIIYYTMISPEYVEIFKEKKISLISFGKFMESKIKKTKTKTKTTIDYPAIIRYEENNSDNGIIVTLKNIEQGLDNFHKEYLKKVSRDEKYVNHLSLSNGIVQFMDIFLPIFTNGTVWINDETTINSSIFPETIKQINPTIFATSDYFWDKISHNKNSLYDNLFLQKICISYDYEYKNLNRMSGFYHKYNTGFIPFHQNNDNIKIKISTTGEIMIKSPSTSTKLCNNKKICDRNWINTEVNGILNNNKLTILNEKCGNEIFQKCPKIKHYVVKNKTLYLFFDSQNFPTNKVNYEKELENIMKKQKVKNIKIIKHKFSLDKGLTTMMKIDKDYLENTI
jgi:septum formation topological specificity factor MinE